MPKRIQLSRQKGWRLPITAVYVARPTRWGNPYRVEEFGLDLALELYRRSVTGNWTPDGIPEPMINGAYALHNAFCRRLWSLENLRGMDLACWCPPQQRCHADILLELANRP